MVFIWHKIEETFVISIKIYAIQAALTLDLLYLIRTWSVFSQYIFDCNTFSGLLQQELLKSKIINLLLLFYFLINNIGWI
jgi:hypothetical protein